MIVVMLCGNGKSIQEVSFKDQVGRGKPLQAKKVAQGQRKCWLIWGTVSS